jgi:hypothetical protein
VCGLVPFLGCLSRSSARLALTLAAGILVGSLEAWAQTPDAPAAEEAPAPGEAVDSPVPPVAPAPLLVEPSVPEESPEVVSEPETPAFTPSNRRSQSDRFPGGGGSGRSENRPSPGGSSGGFGGAPGFGGPPGSGGNRSSGSSGASRSRGTRTDDRSSSGRRSANAFSATDPAGRNSNRGSSNTQNRSGKVLATNDFAAFSLITERNIFNTSRRPGRRSSGDEAPPKRVDKVTLVGTLASERGSYAFFDGSSSDFRKVLEAGKTIATYQVTDISKDGVKLTTGTNSVQLRVGMELRREEEGEWRVSQGSAPPLITSVTASTATSDGSSNDDDEIVKRLMQQREQELK